MLNTSITQPFYWLLPRIKYKPIIAKTVLRRWPVPSAARGSGQNKAENKRDTLTSSSSESFVLEKRVFTNVLFLGRVSRHRGEKDPSEKRGDTKMIRNIDQSSPFPHPLPPPLLLLYSLWCPSLISRHFLRNISNHFFIPGICVFAALSPLCRQECFFHFILEICLRVSRNKARSSSAMITDSLTPRHGPVKQKHCVL